MFDKKKNEIVESKQQLMQLLGSVYRVPEIAINHCNPTSKQSL